MIPPAIQSAPTPGPADRYGKPPKVARPWLIVIALVFALAVGWLSWSVFQILNPPVKAGLVGWTTPVGDEMTATVEIRRDADVAVTCEVVAVDDRLAEVGRSTIKVPVDGRTHLRVTTSIPVESAAIAAELRGCTAAE